MHDHSGGTKTAWLMVLGCLLPLAVLAAIYLFNIRLNTVVGGALVLLCPLSHLLMLRFMGHSYGPPSVQDRVATDSDHPEQPKGGGSGCGV